MAFTPANLVIAWSGTARSGPWLKDFYHGDPCHPWIWTYDADADEIGDVEGSGYFSPMPLALRNGDLVEVTASDGKALYRVEGQSYNAFNSKLTFLKLATVSSFETDYTIFGVS